MTDHNSYSATYTQAEWDELEEARHAAGRGLPDRYPKGGDALSRLLEYIESIPDCCIMPETYYRTATVH
jgi:hypothetical protein